MLLNHRLNFLFLLILGSHKLEIFCGDIGRGFVLFTHDFVCYKEQRENFWMCVWGKERGRLIGWAVKSFQQSLPPLSCAAVHQLDGKKNIKNGTRIMTERESRMDRRFLCPEFNRIKEQQLYETDRQRGRRPAVAAATVLTITHKYTNTKQIIMCHSVCCSRIHKIK